MKITGNGSRSMLGCYWLYMRPDSRVKKILTPEIKQLLHFIKPGNHFSVLPFYLNKTDNLVILCSDAVF